MQKYLVVETSTHKHALKGLIAQFVLNSQEFIVKKGLMKGVFKRLGGKGARQIKTDSGVWGPSLSQNLISQGHEWVNISYFLSII